MLTLSPSKISTYQECPRRYRFQYIDRLGPRFRKERPFLTMGSNVHAALKDFFSLPLRRRKPQALERLLEERWAANRVGFQDAVEEEFYKSRALGQLRRFAERFDLRARPLMTERRIRGRVAGVTLEGIVDRLDREGDFAHLMDYKTGASQDGMSPFPLYLYALILQERRPSTSSPSETSESARRTGHRRLPPVEKVSFLFLENGVTKTWTLDPVQSMQATSQLLGVAYDISGDRAFLPTPGRLCRYCDFLEICPEGRRAG